MATLITRRPNGGGMRSGPTELQQMRQQMDHFLQDLLRGTVPEDPGFWIPDVDIEETDDAWMVQADLPGAKPDDVDVELNDGELVIHGEIKEEEHAGVLRRRARRVGRFEYRVQLPGDVNADGIDAQLHDGVLAIRVPKAAKSQPRRIEVKT
jgi:HSP20 family protein